MAKRQWKKILSVLLCVVIVLSCNTKVLAVGIDITDNGTYLDEKQSEVKSDAQVKSVEKLIDDIGIVEYTYASLSKIVAAEKAYDKLNSEQKLFVQNYGALKASRNAYEALAADNVDTSELTVNDSGFIDALKWTVYTNGLLEISGEGAVPSYFSGEAPWYNYVNSITSILVRSSVTGIGSRAFYGCNKVTDITLPFIGASRTAMGPSSAFGYIFGYSTGSSGCFSGSGYAIGDIYTVSGSYNCYITSITGSQIDYVRYSYTVPSSIKTVNITDATRIPGGAFANCSYITKIVLNDGITSIGEYAFYDSGIKDFAIPESVSSIGQYSFYSCTGLIEMFVPNTVTEIPKYSFYGCSNISRLVLSRHTKSIGDYAFYGCSGFTSLVIPDETESIGSYAFNNCSKIDAINIPDSVITLGSYAFGGCSSAKSLYISSNLKTIPTYAFQNCAGFTSVNVPKTVTRIEARAFNGCNKVMDITLPFVGVSRTATGPSSAFGYIFGYSTGSSGCFSGSGYAVDDIYRINGSYSCYITSISGSQINYNGYSYNVPSSIKTVNITDATRIPDGAFANCSYITKIVLNDGITSIGEYAFYNNPWYNELSDEFVIDGDNVLIKYNGTESEVIIPNNIKYIADSIFKNNTIISSVTLPDGLLSIGKKAFSGCTNLTALTIPKSVIEIGSNAIPSACVINAYQPSAGYNYRSTNRVVLNNSFTTGNETYYYIINDDGCAEIIGCTTTSTEITVPTEIDGIVVNKIGDYGFSGCTTLNSITIPSNILNIGKYAFNGCMGLVNATIPTTVHTVGDYAFNNCTGLVNVTISEGVQALGEGAFYNCTSLIEAVIPDTAAYIGSYAFYNCTSMVTATIGTMAEFIGDYTFYNCSSLENVVIGYSVKTIGDYAFYGCALGRVSIPTVTTSIGRYAFAENAQMTRATLRKNLLTIGDGAFKNCGLLATINIPTTVTYIGLEAFENCLSITSITIPVGVTEINNRTFSNCSSLANVTIKGNVTRIGASAFYNNAFENITLPETLNVIDDSAFRHCINLSEITIPTAVTRIGDAVFIDCSALRNVSMSDSVIDVGYGVFFYNNVLTIYIRKNNGTVSNNMLELQGMSHIVLDPEISAIGNNAFAYCYDLENITYGEETVSNGEYKFSTALKIVGSEAFKDNPKLRNFIVPDTIESFGENAFYNVVQSGYHCKDVTVTFYYVNGVIAPNVLASQHVWHVAINDYIHTLSDGAFYNCPVLETISIPDTVSSVGANVFANPGKNVTATFRGVDGIIDASVYDGKITGIKYIAIDENVNSIGDYAFANTDTVTGVVITNTDNIGSYAFYKGTALDYVEISICKTIGDYAFAENLLLKRVEIDSVKSINDYAFFNDIAINNLYIDADLYHIGEHAFDSCKSVPEVVLPETVREIGAYAFYDCNSMEFINIPNEVTAIKEYTFFGCASLLGIIIPDTVLSIGDYAYYGCVVAESVKMSKQLKSIGAYAFYNCNQVKEFKLPNTLKSIGNYAFRSCSSIKEIKVPNSVTELGDCVFYACTGLEQVKFGVGVTEIGNSVFYGCIKLNEVILNGNVEYIHDLAFYGAEDAIVYSFENQYVEEYCYDMGLEYYEMSKNLIQETINAQIDYDNLIVFTDVKGCVDVSELIVVSEDANIAPTASCINGNLEYYGTGSIVSVSCDDSYAGEYTIIVNGDINGDSVCNVLDVFEAERASNGHIQAPIEQVYAANGMVSDELDVSSYQNVVNLALAS